MKSKKEILNKILLGILTFVLIIYICFNVIFLNLLNISGKYISKDKIYNIVDNINISSILKDEAGNELEEITKIKYELIESGISSESIDSFLNSEELEQFTTNVVANVVNDALSKENIEYRIDNDEISKLLKENISELEVESNGVIETEKQQIISNVENKLPKLVDKANELIGKLGDKLQNSETFNKYKNYFYKSLSIFDIIYSPLVNFIFIGIILSFITLLMYIRKSFSKSLKWIGISFIISSIIIYLINLLIIKFIELNSKISSLITNSILDNIYNDLKYSSNVCIIIGVILIIINIIIYIIKKLKNKKIDGGNNEEEKK